jgi:hypothetical protein
MRLNTMKRKSLTMLVTALFWGLATMAQTATYGPNPPASAASVSPPSGPVWQNPTYAEVQDGRNATIDVPIGESSQNLCTYHFAFNVPASATISGIQVDIKGQQQGANGTAFAISAQLEQSRVG